MGDACLRTMMRPTPPNSPIRPQQHYIHYSFAFSIIRYRLVFCWCIWNM
ncbi:hypothetical protein HanXRQr2_Chr06g0255731 [Helianthus annuus]|uniref:Uncharacterized protein n=1 Tax=Helianthus annuus TaxID=4232 RepID=A0A9K3IS94_HELAN|nr:hypothetical protein HanXRQr2_Chr06g0255731 [Helianthus annuus]KAJ0915176.1 hypothetical protein HanPSC8_Chr06g0246921 [Helianthus annuus]